VEGERENDAKIERSMVRGVVGEDRGPLLKHVRRELGDGGVEWRNGREPSVGGFSACGSSSECRCAGGRVAADIAGDIVSGAACSSLWRVTAAAVAGPKISAET